MEPDLGKGTTLPMTLKSSKPYGVKLDKIGDKMIPYPAKSDKKTPRLTYLKLKIQKM